MPATSADAASETALPPAARRTLITIATYNERASLPGLIEAIFQFAPHADVLVIDDNSPDGTGQWCDEQADATPRLHCLHRAGKLGLGSAVVAGMRHAIDQYYDFVINMDADLSHHPRYLPAIRAAAETADVVIGSRYVAGGGTENWPLSRRLMSRAINAYTRPLLGLPVRDCSGGYRCVRVALLKQLDFGSIRSHGYAFFEEFLWRMKRLGARFREVPITFVGRSEGESKIDAREAAVALGVIFRLGIVNWLGI